MGVLLKEILLVSLCALSLYLCPIQLLFTLDIQKKRGSPDLPDPQQAVVPVRSTRGRAATVKPDSNGKFV